MPVRPFRRTGAGALALASALVVAPVDGCVGSHPARSLAGTTRPAHLSCVTARQVSGWSTSRLAMQTIAVAAGEGDLAAVRSEVKEGAGGLLLFGGSAPADLGTQLRALERRFVPGNLGLLVMTDEEGGEVQRMANLVGSLPWPKWMADHWTPAEIESQVKNVARRMAANGVNMDLAPVLDVDGKDVLPGTADPDGLRSFSGNTSVVTRDGLAFVQGLRQGGVIPVVKHFPGLGGASGNTDVEAAHTLAWRVLEKVAVPPFAAAIRAGAPAVMVSNATVPGLARYPASLSPAVISHELVGRLHFRGLIMTDSLSAVAISAAGFTLPQAVVQALVAGADMVLFGLQASPQATASLTRAIRSAVETAVSDGHLPRGRLLAAAREVLAARGRICG